MFFAGYFCLTECGQRLQISSTKLWIKRSPKTFPKMILQYLPSLRQKSSMNHTLFSTHKTSNFDLHLSIHEAYMYGSYAFLTCNMCMFSLDFNWKFKTKIYSYFSLTISIFVHTVFSSQLLISF